MNFKVGDRVEVDPFCTDLPIGKNFVIESRDGRWLSLRGSDGKVRITEHEICLYLIEPEQKEQPMKIGEHEVKVVSRDEVRVGCQTVKRGEVEQVLKAMDEAPRGIKPSEIPNNRLAVGVSGAYKNDFFVATIHEGRHIVSNIGVGTAGLVAAPTAYDIDYDGNPTFVRLLSPDDLEAMAKFVKERVR